MHKPLVSIIIPTFNRAHLIGETLDSVMAQTYQNWECIIVDDGSTDNSKEIIEGYSKNDTRFQLHQRPENLKKGANACRNYGFELSKGEYINWFDSDDIMFENFIKTKVEIFDVETKVVINVGNVNILNSRNSFDLKWIKSENLFKDYLIWKFKILTPSPMFSKEFLINKKLFNPDIKRGQETELFSRLFFNLTSNSFKVFDLPLVFYRQHENTISSNSKIYNSSYKDSQLFIFIQNLNMSVTLKDKELINHLYNELINLFYEILKNEDKKMLIKSRNEIFKIVKKINLFKAFLFYCFSNFLITTNLRSIIIKKSIKKLF